MMVVLACGSAEPSGPKRYSGSEWSEGVDIEIRGRTEAADSATVLFPDGLPSYLSNLPKLKEDGVAVIQPGEGGFDAIVLYRSGGFCGFMPDVSVSGDARELLVEIMSTSGDNCDALEYDAAIGLELSPSFQQAIVVGTHSLERLPASIVGLNSEIAAQAAGLRARHRSLKLPDALVLATAEQSRADQLITTDRKWPTAKAMKLNVSIRSSEPAPTLRSPAAREHRPVRSRAFQCGRLLAYVPISRTGGPGPKAML